MQGRQLPVCHRIAEGSTLLDISDGRCIVQKPNGERCRAPASRSYGICSGHVGLGMQDYARAAKAAHASKARLRMRRQLLGIGPARIGNPRQRARLAAAERAETIAAALLEPIDRADLGPIERQIAAIRVLDATYPLQTTTLEVELPSDPEQVDSLGWQEMQALAARLLSPEP